MFNQIIKSSTLIYTYPKTIFDQEKICLKADQKALPF